MPCNGRESQGVEEDIEISLYRSVLRCAQEQILFEAQLSTLPLMMSKNLLLIAFTNGRGKVIATTKPTN